MENGKIVVVFRVRVNTGLEAEYERRLGEISEIASKSPGLLSLKRFEDPDGTQAYIIEWDNEENLNRWRNHPVHQEAMKDGLYACLTGDRVSPKAGPPHRYGHHIVSRRRLCRLGVWKNIERSPS